jgi:prepilin-type N-terminal cleavage/methylation domain-containing protein
VNLQQPNSESTRRSANRERGFTMIELGVVVMIILIVSAMAIFALQPTMQDAKFDTAMRQVLDQLRQAREYSIANRRYVQVTFPVVLVAGINQYQVVMTQRNDLTTGGGAINPVLSTVPIQFPAQYLLLSALDTPDGFCKGAPTTPVQFVTAAGGAPISMLFQSDGELVDGASFQPINGTIFLGVPNQQTSARAITVLGTTGRVRGWKGTGAAWFQF